MNTIETIARRKSIRSYTGRAVEAEKLTAIVNAGNEAAKAGQVYFKVITKPEALTAVAEGAKRIMQASTNDFLKNVSSVPGYNPIYNAPVMIVVSAESTNDTQAAGMNIANAACAAQNMLLAATELGLGSCYVVSPTLAFMVPEVCAEVGIDKNLTPACAVVLGYTDDMSAHAQRPADPNNISYCQ